MKNPDKKIPLSRRGFMARSACSAMGLTGIVNTLAHLKLMEGALAATVPGVTDYKALVVLFHFGATDANNVLMPGAGHPGRTNYNTHRGVLALPLGQPAPNTPHAITADNLTGGDASFALHPRMGDLKTIFDAGNMAFAANVGTVVVPTTAATYGSVPLPPQLFSHSDQQNQWQSSLPDKPYQSGWGGRIADLLNPAWNEPSLPGYAGGKISMSVSLSGINDLQLGLSGDVSQYSVTNTGAITLNGYGTNYSSVLADASDPTSYNGTGSNQRRLKAFQDIMNYTHAHLFEEGYNQVVRRARENEGFVGSALAEADTWLHPSAVDNNSNPWGFIEGTFLLQAGLNPAANNVINNLSSLSRQLLMIAKLIAGRRCTGNRRQIFFCSYGGHDTHQDEGGYSAGTGYVPGDLDDNMTFLNDALKAYDDCMHALAAKDLADGTIPAGEKFEYNDSLLASHSDFNRTFTPNGSIAGPSGSDHAWATNVYMMGGDVDGKKVYGYYPDLNPLAGGAWTTPGSTRGRWVPTTSIEQFSAPLASWLGIGPAEIATIFPNLNRFADPFTTGYDPTNFTTILANANMDYLV